jgi:hypothetical protein
MNSYAWKSRSLASLMTAAGFLIMTLSGIVAFIVPHGRIAYWTDWKFLGLTKANWADIHVVGCVLFLVACGFHIYFNWRPLTGYFLDRVKGGIKLTKELAVTLVVAFCVLPAAIYHIPPLSYISDLSDQAKESWVGREYEPPFGRAELLDLRTFCKKQEIPFDLALAELQAKGIKVGAPKDSLAEIAKRNGKSPLHLYISLKSLEGKAAPQVNIPALTPHEVEEKYAGSGIGRKTLAEVTASMNLNKAGISRRLAGLNIDVKEDELLKQAAERNKLAPIELLKAILIEDYDPGK